MPEFIFYGVVFVQTIIIEKREILKDKDNTFYNEINKKYESFNS